ncbi:MAG: GumC family protein, partial [Opitutales bacterium]
SAMGNSGQVEAHQINSSEDLNTQIEILESMTIVNAVKDRLQEEEREQFMEPYRDSYSFLPSHNISEILMRNRRIIPERMSLIVNIAYTHPDPEMAARVANLFADEYIEYNLSHNIDQSMQAVEDLRTRADRQREEVEDLDMQLAEYREDNNAVSLSEQENIARQQLATLNDIELSARNELDKYQTRRNLIEMYQVEGKDLWQLSFIAEQERVRNLLQSLSDLEVEISTLSKRYKEKHPEMIRLLEAKRETLAELQEASQNAVDKVYAGYAEGLENFEVAEKRLAQKEQELIDLSKLRVDYASLERELDVQEGYLEAIIGRMTQEQTEVNLKNPNARIVDEAFAPAPENYSSPNIPMNLAAGFFGGLAVGTGLVFLVAFLDDRVKSAFDIEGTIGLPLLGVVPRIKKLDTNSKAQAVATNADQHVTEIFRSMHSTLKLNDESKHAKVVLVSSTIPGEGKSFISSNLTLTFASHGEKTLLVDADLRLPNVARSLQLENEVGLLNHLTKGDSLDDVILKEIYPNMDVLTSGGKSKNPTQIMSSAEFEAMLAELRDRYDRIVIDSPPLAAVSDALTLLPYADGVVYVIKFNTVKRKTAMANIRRLWESDTPVFGAVLNNISGSFSSYYYSQATDPSYQDYYIRQEEELEEDLAASVEPGKGKS